MNFGQFISQKRKSQGLTLKELAKILGVSVGYLRDVETGHLPYDR